MPELLAGIDIGGTKCAVTLAYLEHGQIYFVDKRRFDTPSTPEATLQQFSQELSAMLEQQDSALTGIGISCGGPLNSTQGVVVSPPNLPGWVNVPVVAFFQQRFSVPVRLQNDANAGALAEWLWGAGRGYSNIIFLTFGTGMGAGLILDGRLYSGTNDLAGEAGHIRLAEDGPVGFGKAGSFEGFCSGGGIARLAATHATTLIEAGTPPDYCPTLADLPNVTAKRVADAANEGDPAALEIFDMVARRLGQGLSILIDILNPQRIIIGSIYLRQQSLLEERMQNTLRQEAIPLSLDVCEIVPPELGEAIGDYAALAVASYKPH
jgi:glucokinase